MNDEWTRRKFLARTSAAAAGTALPTSTMLAALLGAVLIYLWAALLSQQGVYYQFQGRYLYPAVIPFAFFLIGGIGRFFSASNRKVAGLVFLSFFLLLDTWSICGYILPTFYG